MCAVYVFIHGLKVFCNYDAKHNGKCYDKNTISYDFHISLWNEDMCSSFHEIFHLDFLKIYMASWRLMILWGSWQWLSCCTGIILGHCPPFRCFYLSDVMEVGSALHLISLVVIILTEFLLLFIFIVAPRTISGLVQCQVGVILAWYLKVLTSIPVIATNIKDEK